MGRERWTLETNTPDMPFLGDNGDVFDGCDNGGCGGDCDDSIFNFESLASSFLTLLLLPAKRHGCSMPQSRRTSSLEDLTRYLHHNHHHYHDHDHHQHILRH